MKKTQLREMRSRTTTTTKDVSPLLLLLIILTSQGANACEPFQCILGCSITVAGSIFTGNPDGMSSQLKVPTSMTLTPFAVLFTSSLNWCGYEQFYTVTGNGQGSPSMLQEFRVEYWWNTEHSRTANSGDTASASVLQSPRRICVAPQTGIDCLNTFNDLYCGNTDKFGVFVNSLEPTCEVIENNYIAANGVGTSCSSLPFRKGIVQYTTQYVPPPIIIPQEPSLPIFFPPSWCREFDSAGNILSQSNRADAFDPPGNWELQPPSQNPEPQVVGEFCGPVQGCLCFGNNIGIQCEFQRSQW